MTIAQLEQRLISLEQTVKQLQTQFTEPKIVGSDDDFISGADYDLTTEVPPHGSFTIRAKFIGVAYPPPILGLSDEEWANLPIGEEDECNGLV